MNLNAISLFSSSGIGDLGLKINNIKTVIACEILFDRIKLFRNNFPEAKCFNGDIWNEYDKIINYYKENFNDNPFIIIATPPCQGMSSNGMGKMLSNYRKGLRPKFDPRNRLIIPAIKIIKSLQPEWVIIENVVSMENTIIVDENNKLINIMDYIFKEIGTIYCGKPQIIDCADFGVPQHRKRLLTILTKNKSGIDYFNKYGKLFPEPSHSEKATLTTKTWVTIKDAIGKLPMLKAENGKNIDVRFNELHKVPILDEKKLFWIDNTPEGKSAFNNQCINPNCMYQGNGIHSSSKNNEKINKYNQNTPLYCQKCGELLPRPYVEDKKTKEKRIMKGYVSAYKRMVWNEPASTITKNFQFACSDNKIHPSQSRVLSLYEGLVLQTIANYNYSFKINDKIVPDGTIRDTIGESVPPLLIDTICKFILNFY